MSMQKIDYSSSKDFIGFARQNLDRFFTALSFLTIIPRIKLPGSSEITQEELGKSTIYFPLVGWFLGVILWIFLGFLDSFSLDNTIKATLLALTLSIMTGGLHLDGLADTFDGIGSRSDKEKTVEIMKRGDIGVFGTSTLFFAVILKILTFNFLIDKSVFYWIPLILVLSRWSMVFSMTFLASARQEGLGKMLIEGSSTRELTYASLIMFVLTLYLAQESAVMLILFAVISSLAIGGLFRLKFGGMSGDTLGAQCEIIEILALLIVTLLI